MSEGYLKIKGRAVGWYYFAQSWVFFELSLVSKEEKQLLGKQLAKPESILERGYGDKARFHLVADKDFEILKKIIKDRVIK